MTKRRRRIGKIEDIKLDIDALFQAKKRFKPDDSTVETVSSSQPDLQLHLAKQTFSGAHSLQTRSLLKQNLLTQYMESVNEYDVAN